VDGAEGDRRRQARPRRGQDALRARSSRHAIQIVSAPGTTAITMAPAANVATSAGAQRRIHLAARCLILSIVRSKVCDVASLLERSVVERDSQMADASATRAWHVASGTNRVRGIA
jgi:hypothetical protein